MIRCKISRCTITRATSPPDSVTCYRDQWGADRVEIVGIDNAAHALLPEQPVAVAEAIIGYMKKIK